MLSTDINPFPTSMTSKSAGDPKSEDYVVFNGLWTRPFHPQEKPVAFQSRNKNTSKKKSRERVNRVICCARSEKNQILLWNKWGQTLTPLMVFAKMAAIGQCSLSHYSSFVQQNQTLSPGMFSDVNRWLGMFRWFLPSLVFMLHIISRAHFNQIASKHVATSGVFWLKWRLNVTQDDLQPSKTRSRRKPNHLSGTFRASGVGSSLQIYIF